MIDKALSVIQMSHLSLISYWIHNAEFTWDLPPTWVFDIFIWLWSDQSLWSDWNRDIFQDVKTHPNPTLKYSCSMELSVPTSISNLQNKHHILPGLQAHGWPDSYSLGFSFQKKKII